MQDPLPVDWDSLIQDFPPIWPVDDLRARIAAQNKQSRRCVVALDDDPTGTQTVHNVWVLTVYDLDSLVVALQDEEPALYVLTNTRSLPAEQAQAVVRSAAINLIEAAGVVGRPLTLVSRSDSTLRGHFPAETDTLQEIFTQAGHGSFDGICLVPAFPEGGRYTAHDVHWVRTGNHLTPAAQTAFARDPVFGYTRSHLPSWVEEKTGGRIQAASVASISIETIRRGGPAAVAENLQKVSGGQVVIVNAIDYRDLEVFVSGVLLAERQGKQFLFRTAASFVKAAAGIADRPLLTRGELLEGGRLRTGGLVVCGSHVPLSTSQLDALRLIKNVEMVEFPVSCVRDEGARQQVVDQKSSSLNQLLARGSDAVLYTSREVLAGKDSDATLLLAAKVSASLIEIVRQIAIQPRFIIGKGGITSSDLATDGLNIRAARVLGQAYPGVPVWKLGPGSRWPGMNYIIFPGNVGESDTLANTVMSLQ
jgi:uncharacterized protein YgbK (DUF1537 family)